MSKQKIIIQRTVLLLIFIALTSFVLIGLNIKFHQTKKAVVKKKIASINNTKTKTNSKTNGKPSGMKMAFENYNKIRSVKEWINEWKNERRGRLTIEQAKDPKNAAFTLKFPKDYSLTGKLEVVNNGGGVGVAGTDIYMFFSKGIKVEQIKPDPIEVKGLADYADYITTNEETKNDFKKVKINGVYGWAAESKINETFGQAYKSPGSVSWFKNGILYTVYSYKDVYGNKKISIDQLLKIAKLFN